MTIHTRRRRRLALLLVLLLVSVAAIVSAYQWREHQREERAQWHRQEGFAALERSDYIDAMTHLGAYLKHHDDDVEALYAYAQARRRVDEPDGKHLTQAIGVLQRILELEPVHEGARTDLLELYTLCRYNHEVIDLAESILETDPRRVDAWRAKAVALSRLKRPKDALAAAEQCLIYSPHDVRTRALWLDLHRQLGASNEQVMETARAYYDEHEDSPIRDLIMAYASRLAGDLKAMIHWLRLASERVAPDDDYVVLLVRLMDEARLRQDAMVALERYADEFDSPQVRIEFIRRLWEARRYHEIVEHLHGVDPKQRDVNSEVLGLLAVSLYELSRAEDGARIVAALSQRGADSTGAAWAMVIDAIYSVPDPSPRTIIEACREALTTDPDNACFAYAEGAAWWSLGETDLTLKSWQAASQQRPNWLTPRINSVYALLTVGQVEAAQRLAVEVVERAPNRIDAHVVWIMAHTSGLNPDDAPRAAHLLEAVSRIQDIAPYEPQTLPLQVALLAHAGQRDRAVERLGGVLTDAPALDESTWLKLAAISQRYGLGMQSQCFDQVQRRYGLTPGLALQRALSLYKAGQPQEARQLFADAADRSVTNPLAWRLATGTYLDRVSDPDAAGHCAAIQAEYPNLIAVQRWALSMRCIRADRAVADRTIERIRALTGQDAVTWRVARASWLMDDESPDAAAGAARLLEPIVDSAPTSLNARIILARSLDEMNHKSRASAQMLAAAQLQPKSAQLALEAASLLQSMHDFAGAREHLRRVLANDNLSGDHLVRAAALLARQGDDAEAVAILERLDESTGLSVNQLMLLGRLYARTGRPQLASALCPRLLERATPMAIEFVADHYATVGQIDAARTALRSLDTPAVSQADRAAVVAQFEERHGQPDVALRYWRQAVAAKPHDGVLRRRLAAQLLRMGQAQEALAELGAAAGAIPNDAAIQFALAQRDLIAAFADEPAFRALLLNLVLDAQQQRASAEALTMVRGVDGPDWPQTLARLRALCDRHSNCLPVQSMTIRLHLAHHRADEAATIAMRAMSAFPSSWESAWLASEALAAAGRWSEALAAGKEWRRRTGATPMAADTVIAEALLQLRRPDEAAAQLRPHLSAALADPTQLAGVVTRYARALIAQGQLQELIALFGSLWQDDRRWITVAMDLAMRADASQATLIEWLERVAAAAPMQGDQRTRLAAIWVDLAQRYDAASIRQRAQRLLDELTDSPDAGAQHWLMVGMLAEQQSDAAAAVRAYRRAVQMSPDMAAACNNLAMLLSDQRQSLQEALALAERAAAAHPQSPAFLDTLAHVQHRLGMHELAVQTSRKALVLQPTNPKWQARLREFEAAPRR